jgi:hypothetical protein
MPSFLKKTFEAIPNINRRYEVKIQDGTKIATYNPLTQQIYFSKNPKLPYSLEELKEMSFEDRRTLKLNGDEIQSIYLLIKDLPLIENKTASTNLESKPFEKEEDPDDDQIPAIKMEHTIGKNTERKLSLFPNRSPEVINDRYTDPEVCSEYDNIRGKNLLYVLFRYKVNGKFVPMKIPGNDLNLIKDLNVRVKKMEAMRNGIASKLLSGWDPVKNKS